MVSIILKRQSKEQPTHAGDSAEKRCSCSIDRKLIAKLKAGRVHYQQKLIHTVPLLVQFPPWFNLYFANVW